MAYDLETAKIRLGIDPSDTSVDHLITAAMDVALAVAETWCSRGFLEEIDAEESFTETGNRIIQLYRFPVTAVTTVTGDTSPIDAYGVRKRTGQLIIPGSWINRDVTVVYTGGYAVLPADLEYALWMMFDGYYAAPGGTASGGAGGVSSITLPDVGTVRFNEGGSSEVTSGDLYADAFALLQPYRVMSA